MRVETLTFQHTTNYGAALQCYALKHFLSSFSSSVGVLNYYCEKIELDNQPVSIRNVAGGRSFARLLLKGRCEKKRRIAFEEFSRTQLDIADDFVSDLAQLDNKEVELVIVGSDQVWNPILTGNDSQFFLDGVSKEISRAAYAVSLGEGVGHPFLKTMLQRCATDFRYLSAREQSAVEFISECTGRSDVKLVCDPVFLLDDQQWRSVAIVPRDKEPYLLVYSLGSLSREEIALAKEIASANGLKIIALHYGSINYPGIKNIRDCGPLEFLGYMERASIVMTSSFHGLAFSLIFGKEFIPYINQVNKLRRGRIDNLLGMYNLAAQDIDTLNVRRNLACSVSNGEKMELLIEDSKSYLRECISCCEL